MIRGHSESELVNKITLGDIKGYDPNKVSKAYVLFVSSNEICSACTNVMPDVKKIVAEKLALSDENKVQILYFPIADHQDGKLYIKESPLERQYKRGSSSGLEEGVIILDADGRGDYIKVKLSDEIKQAEGFYSQSIKVKKSQLPIADVIPTNQVATDKLQSEDKETAITPSKVMRPKTAEIASKKVTHK